MENNITFVSLYLEGSKMLEHEPEWLSTYKELDALLLFIENHPQRDSIKHSLSESRQCIIIPYELTLEKRLPPDSKNIKTGQKLCGICPEFDHFRSLVIDRMQDQSMCKIMDTVENLNKWKIVRLGRVIDKGWEKYRKDYLKPLKNKEKYISMSREIFTK
jgi:hypothetical protein